jgi:hypothetical protein
MREDSDTLIAVCVGLEAFVTGVESKRNVDFLVIGAQKSGATSLFEYLQCHPELYLPPSKEVSFFVEASKFPRGHGADEDKLWGEVCPSYMGHTSAPANIYANRPDMKLVAILRNPIDRAYSHYRMTSRREVENRSFRWAIEDLRREPAGTIRRSCSSLRCMAQC